MAIQRLQIIIIVALIAVCLVAEWRFPSSRASVATEAEHWAGNHIRLLRQQRPTSSAPRYSNDIGLSVAGMLLFRFSASAEG